MHQLNINRQDGGIPKTLPGEDHISGLIAYLTENNLPQGFALWDKPMCIRSLAAAEALGITDQEQSADLTFLHYHLKEIFRTNPACVLYLLIAHYPEDVAQEYREVFTLQKFAGGSIRQMGVWDPYLILAADTEMHQLEYLTGNADCCESDLHAPLSIIYAPSIDSLDTIPLENLAKQDWPRVSILIGQSGEENINKKLADADYTGISSIGTALGMLSRAKVHQSISWVKEFPTGIDKPAFNDAREYNVQDTDEIAQAAEAGFMFLRTYPSMAGSYFNDSRTLGKPTGDYNTIEAVRTMDKAVRGIRTYLTPELGGNIYIDPETGKMQAHTVSHLETTANRALEDMERAGELSGYKVEIDPEQDVLSTSTVEIVIKQVPVGVMRKINVKIGFTKKV